jgi:hypothetical protein
VPLVARPRNQHYLHEVVSVWRPLIFPTSERRKHSDLVVLRLRSLQHRRQVALQLDLERPLFRSQDDGVHGELLNS